MSPSVTKTILIICLFGFALMIVLSFHNHVVTYFASPQPIPEKSAPEQFPLQGVTARLYDVLGKGPLSYVREKGHVYDLAQLDMDKLSTEELLMTMHSYIDNTDILCQRKFRMGNIGDGGWEICDDPDVRPQEPCIIYSFGISNDFSFDDDSAKMYGCHVYSFDPSMTKEKDQFDRSSNVHFFKIGLDGRTYVNAQKWSLLTFRDIRKKLGHLNSTIGVVKMDIESSEWGAIPEMFESGELYKIHQLLIEFHVVSQDRGYLLPRLKAIQAIERSGLKKFYAHKNHACKTQVNRFPVVRTMCYEVHYIRR